MSRSISRTTTAHLTYRHTLAHSKTSHTALGTAQEAKPHGRGYSGFVGRKKRILTGFPSHSTLIGVGFSSKSASLNRAPGWEPESWGYHGDDGHCFQAQNVGKQYGPTFGYGDVIGCGVNFRTGTAFFTKNGHYLGKSDEERERGAS